MSKGDVTTNVVWIMMMIAPIGYLFLTMGGKPKDRNSSIVPVNTSRSTNNYGGQKSKKSVI